MRMNRAVATAVLVWTLALAPAKADTAACVAALTEASAIQSDAGLWLAEARMLRSRKKRVEGTYGEEGWKEEFHNHGLRYGKLIRRILDLRASLFALRKDAACVEDAAINAALDKADTFLSGDVAPRRRTLPDGWCPSSPDLDAPLVPCAAKPAQ